MLGFKVFRCAHSRRDPVRYIDVVCQGVKLWPQLRLDHLPVGYW
jgi:hypothetical protein